MARGLTGRDLFWRQDRRALLPRSAHPAAQRQHPARAAGRPPVRHRATASASTATRWPSPLADDRAGPLPGHGRPRRPHRWRRPARHRLQDRAQRRLPQPRRVRADPGRHPVAAAGLRAGRPGGGRPRPMPRRRPSTGSSPASGNFTQPLGPAHAGRARPGARPTSRRSSTASRPAASRPTPTGRCGSSGRAASRATATAPARPSGGRSGPARRTPPRWPSTWPSPPARGPTVAETALTDARRPAHDRRRPRHHAVRGGGRGLGQDHRAGRAGWWPWSRRATTSPPPPPSRSPRRLPPSCATGSASPSSSPPSPARARSAADGGALPAGHRRPRRRRHRHPPRLRPTAAARAPGRGRAAAGRRGHGRDRFPGRLRGAVEHLPERLFTEPALERVVLLAFSLGVRLSPPGGHRRRLRSRLGPGPRPRAAWTRPIPRSSTSPSSWPPPGRRSGSGPAADSTTTS